LLTPFILTFFNQRIYCLNCGVFFPGVITLTKRCTDKGLYIDGEQRKRRKTPPILVAHINSASFFIYLFNMADEVDYNEDVDMTEAKVATESAPNRKVTTIKAKGRGHNKTEDASGEDDRYNGRGGVFENIQRGGGSGPLQCNLFNVF
jgi:hypothetical protein